MAESLLLLVTDYSTIVIFIASTINYNNVYDVTCMQI